MATVKFYLQDKKSEKKSSLRLFFNYNNKVLKYSVNISIEPKLWDSKKYRIKHQAKNSTEINRVLNNVEENILDVYHDLLTKENLVNNKLLKKELDIRLNKEDKEDYFEYMLRYIEQKNELKEKTKQDYLQTYHTIREFEAQTGFLISFDSINLDFYNRFQDYMLNTLEHSINTFGKRIKIIKSIMNYATEIGINKNLSYQKKDFKVLSKNIKREYLTTDEVQKIYDLDCNGALEKSKDAFLLMCYLGIRFSDYKRITKSNISNNHLDIIMSKTNESVSIPIHPNAMNIIKKWNYDLPKMSNPKLNLNIKRICRDAKIDQLVQKNIPKYKLITCHTARRSFATNGYLSNVSTRDLMRITGHKKESTFLNYVQVKRDVVLSKILEIYPTELKKVV
ncbi:tyrosine-type recombinase/integrase [Flavobacteriales bacterium]|nr:tyrosine-type recombinase/integrase [Flavobacteriales bacterium]